MLNKMNFALTIVVVASCVVSSSGEGKSADNSSGAIELVKAIVNDRHENCPYDLRVAFDQFYNTRVGKDLSDHDIDSIVLFIDHLSKWEEASMRTYYYPRLTELTVPEESVNAQRLKDQLDRVKPIKKKKEQSGLDPRSDGIKEVVSFEEHAFRQVELLLDGYGIGVFGFNESMKRASEILDSSILHDENRVNMLRATLMLKNADVDLLTIMEHFERIDYEQAGGNESGDVLSRQIKAYMMINNERFGGKFSQDMKHVYLNSTIKKLDNILGKGADEFKNRGESTDKSSAPR